MGEPGQAADNDELRTIYEADQADRRDITAGDDFTAVALRDQQRHRRITELIDAGMVVTGTDHYHAAMVFQHGGTPASYRRACELAAAAHRLGERRGAWLAAAALDRWLVARGRPQRFGTQFTSDGGRWVLSPYDEATTDAERARWDVPPLAVSLARADDMTRDDPPPTGPPGTGLPPLQSTVTVVIGRAELAAGTVTVTVPWAADPIVVPLPDLYHIPCPGLGDGGGDLLVQLVVDDGEPPPELD